VLAGSRRGGDADNLARTALKDQKVTEADVVAGNGYGVRHVGLFGASGRADRSRARGAYTDVNFFPVNMIMMLLLMMMGTPRQLVGSTVETVTEGMVVSIFIIVTHLVGGLGSRRVDGLLSDADFFTGSLLVAWSWVNSGTTDTNLFVVGGGLLLEAWRVNSGTGNTGLLAIGWLGSGRIYGLIESDLFAIAGLELGSVLTFGEVKLSLVGVTAVMRKLDGDVSVVVSALVWKVDVDVGFGVFDFGSSLFADVDIFSAARTVLAIFFTSDMDLFLSELAGTRRERGVGGDRRVFTFPSDALLMSVGKIDLSLDVCLLDGLLFCDVVSIRRRENAERDRNAGVKIQRADL